MTDKFIHADVGAETEQYRDAIGSFVSVITKDEHEGSLNGKTTIEYICAEGDPPFVKYRLTLEAVSEHSEEEYKALAEGDLYG